MPTSQGNQHRGNAADGRVLWERCLQHTHSSLTVGNAASSAGVMAKQPPSSSDLDPAGTPHRPVSLTPGVQSDRKACTFRGD